ncbi:phosphatidylethanolamine-binding protein [Lasiosphaeria miniovina]|uniref:Phosphatidylethanolamine-binding protein n=1 Tax=Lasiosphaeria miniovina TaxID=1954250 RepID=A0AA40ATT2_9PEZI|nr:phosphatidylethanolamine-binding protein [Lasiosphaeria miniovina]KAK0721853.1 phosphatidylethanolamine-binding protein [Lasiosphaeria miniovina]
MSHEPTSARDVIDALDAVAGHAAPLRIHFPSAVVTHPGTELSKAASAPAPAFSVAASAIDAMVSMPNCDLSPTTSAASASSTSSLPVPAPVPVPATPVATAAAAVSATAPAALPSPRFIVTSIDLDPPFPSFPFLGPVLHGLQADLTLATAALDPDDEFIPLEPAVPNDSSSDSSGSVVAWVHPAPPGLSGPHRYVSLLWEQPAGLTPDGIRDALGFAGAAAAPEDEAGENALGLMQRARFDMEGLEKKLGLGRVVAGNYFTCAAA